MTTIINASTSSGLVQTADNSGTLELQSNGTTQLTVSATGTYGQLKSGTAQASTSGTSIDFTSIPSWVKRITVMFNGVSTNGSSVALVQVGSGTIQTSGYVGNADNNSGVGASYTTGLGLERAGSASMSRTGLATLALFGNNTWVATYVGAEPGTTQMAYGATSVTLSGTLDRVRITTVNGTDTFDAGSINILYEG